MSSSPPDPRPQMNPAVARDGIARLHRCFLDLDEQVRRAAECPNPYVAQEVRQDAAQTCLESFDAVIRGDPNLAEWVDVHGFDVSEDDPAFGETDVDAPNWVDRLLHVWLDDGDLDAALHVARRLLALLDDAVAHRRMLRSRTHLERVERDPSSVRVLASGSREDLIGWLHGRVALRPDGRATSTRRTARSAVRRRPRGRPRARRTHAQARASSRGGDPGGAAPSEPAPPHPLARFRAFRRRRSTRREVGG